MAVRRRLVVASAAGRVAWARRLGNTSNAGDPFELGVAAQLLYRAVFADELGRHGEVARRPSPWLDEVRILNGRSGHANALFSQRLSRNGKWCYDLEQ